MAFTTSVMNRIPEKSPDEIERDMAHTRDSITDKVARLENQVLGTIHSVTNTVEAVKDAVQHAPTAMSETMEYTFRAVSARLRAFDAIHCIRDNPLAALGTTTVAGFLAGYFLGSRRSTTTPKVEKDTPASQPPMEPQSTDPGLADGLFGNMGKEIRDMGHVALSSATDAIKQNIRTAMPGLVDAVIHRAVDATNGNGNGAFRIHGPNSVARGESCAEPISSSPVQGGIAERGS